MKKRRFKAEEIVNKLREADVLIAQGRTVAQACEQIGVTEQTYYRWRKEYGGLKKDQAKMGSRLLVLHDKPPDDKPRSAEAKKILAMLETTFKLTAMPNKAKATDGK